MSSMQLASFVTMICLSCSCLFDGNIRQNTKKLQSLMRSYQQIYEELAKYFTRGDFVVETVPALISLPPQIRSGIRNCHQIISYISGEATLLRSTEGHTAMTASIIMAEPRGW